MQLNTVYDNFLLSMEGVLSKNTIGWYETKLRPLISRFGEDDIEQIDINSLRLMRAELSSRDILYPNSDYRKPTKGQLSKATIRAHLRATRRIFNWAIEEGYLDNNPASRLRMPPKEKDPRRGIADSDRHAMLNITKENVRDHAILMFVWETACRREGVTGLKYQNLDLKAGEAIIHEKGKSRIVFFQHGTRTALQSYFDVHPEENINRVFVGKCGPLTTFGIYSVFKRAAKKAGVTELWSPHQWRHARARYWLKKWHASEASEPAPGTF